MGIVDEFFAPDPDPAAKVEETEEQAEERELREFRAELAAARIQTAAEEAAAAARQAESDARLVEATDRQRDEARQWRMWQAEWRATTRREDLEEAQYLFLRRQREDVEAEAAASEAALAAAEAAALQEIAALEAQKRRYLVECGAWLQDWGEAYEQRWADARRGAAAERQWRDEAERREVEELEALKARARRFGPSSSPPGEGPASVPAQQAGS